MYPDSNSPTPDPYLDGLISPDGRLHPAGPMWPDPMLDNLEYAIEYQTPVEPVPVEMQDPMHDALDIVEHETENELESQQRPAQISGKTTPSEVPKPEPYDEPQAPVAGIQGPVSESPLPPPGMILPVREFPYPDHRMHGGSTGIRNTGGGTGYCYLRETHVQEEDCEQCRDYEAMEDPADESKQCCRYLYCHPY